MKSKKTALFVTYGGGHVNAMIPVIQEMQRRGWHTEVLGLTLAANELKKHHIPYYGFKDFVQAGDEFAIQKGRELAAQMHTDNKGIDFEESVAYLGLSYADLVNKFGETIAAEQFAKQGRHAFLPHSILQRVISRFQPDVLVATNSPRAERAALEVASENSIPTVCIVDLFSVKEWYRLFADRICVLSTITRDNLLKQGASETAIRVTGNPAFDKIYTCENTYSSDWRFKCLGVKDDRPVLLWVCQPGYWDLTQDKFFHFTNQEQTKFLNQIFEFSKKFHAKLLVRPHPSQSTQLFQEWMARLPSSSVQLVDDLPLHQLLSHVSITLTAYSTVGLEAVLLGSPLIMIEMQSGPTVLPLAQYGLAESVAPSGIEVAIQKLLAMPAQYSARKSKVSEYFYDDGKSAHRVADVIQDLSSH